jgi:hypothetical protein
MSSPQFFDCIGETSFESMERISSQGDGSRRNDYMDKVKKCLEEAQKKNEFDCLSAMTDYVDSISIPSILSQISSLTK